MLSFIARRIWCWWFFLSGFLFFLPLYPIFVVLLSKEKWFPLAWRLKKVWAHWIIWSTGIHYKITTEVPLDPKRGYVICPNHTSYLDIVLTNIAFPNYFHFMGKAELKHIPMFNIFFQRMNISVDRSSRIDSLKAFKRANKDLQKGIGIAIFPEATIPACAPFLGNFKSGAFRLAIQNQSPIVPITFLDNYKIFPDNPTEKLVVRPGFSRIIVHAPIETKGLTENDAGLLKKMVFDTIEKSLYEHKVIPSLKKDRKTQPDASKDDADCDKN
jgi:1-acyl-sn-glycerol-3-phosphate acyltransferase